MPGSHCRLHLWRPPTVCESGKRRDPQTQDVVAIREYISTYEQNRTIWMDGRPHPPDYAAHTWMGFSTGKWEGNILTVYTTHIKQGWDRRNGVPSSDKVTLTEHFIRHGDHLDPRQRRNRPGVSDRAADQDAGSINLTGQAPTETGCGLASTWMNSRNAAQATVPSYMPGENPFVNGIRRQVPDPRGRGTRRTADHVSGISRQDEESETAAEDGSGRRGSMMADSA